MLEPPVPWLRHHPSAWRAGTLDVEGLHQAADELCRQPGFAAHVRHFAACWLAGYDTSPLLATAMRNNARYVMLVACLWLDHVRDRQDPTDGITASRLIAFYEKLGRGLVSASPWRVKAMLAHARTCRLLQPAARSGDARRRPLEPTPALREAMAGWMAGFLRGVAPVLPLPAAPEQMVQRPGLVGEVFTYRLSALVQDRYAINAGLPALRWIVDREKGYRLFLTLMRSFEPDADGDGGRVQAVPQQMAARAGVARTTVLNFVSAGTERGWFVPGPGRQLRLGPAFTDEALRWFGREFLWMHTMATAAWMRLRAEP